MIENLLVNSKKMNFEKSITVLELLQHLSIDPEKVVVEVDLDIISKDLYSIKKLRSNSKVELIRFVGGG